MGGGTRTGGTVASGVVVCVFVGFGIGGCVLIGDLVVMGIWFGGGCGLDGMDCRESEGFTERGCD